MKNSRAFLVGLTALGLVLATPAMASAGPLSVPAPDPVVKSDQVVAPFNLDLTRTGVLVADGFTNMVGTLDADGSITPKITPAPGAAGIAVSRNGRTTAFTTTEGAGPGGITASGLNLWGPRGAKVYADTFAYEHAHNPDGHVAYGVENPSQCVTDTLTAAGLPVSYTGILDSHAYSVAEFGSKWVVADAGANALFVVDRRGKIRTLTVFPAQPATITAEMAAALGLDDCVVGTTYRFEAVPTDVEVGRDGWLYVTTLPGGPETPAAGARGALWKVSPWTGKAKRIAGGFLGATNLAVGLRGEIYVTEYFAGTVSDVTNGKKSHYLDLMNVVAIESDGRGSLWAGTTISLDPSAPQVPGTIVEIVNGTWQHKWSFRH
ncbi:ScyD/ScyE family protein [Microbacterium sp. MC2]